MPPSEVIKPKWSLLNLMITFAVFFASIKCFKTSLTNSCRSSHKYIIVQTPGTSKQPTGSKRQKVIHWNYTEQDWTYLVSNQIMQTKAALAETALSGYKNIGRMQSWNLQSNSCKPTRKRSVHIEQTKTMGQPELIERLFETRQCPFHRKVYSIVKKSVCTLPPVIRYSGI